MLLIIFISLENKVTGDFLNVYVNNNEHPLMKLILLRYFIFKNHGMIREATLFKGFRTHNAHHSHEVIMFSTWQPRAMYNDNALPTNKT